MSWEFHVELGVDQLPLPNRSSQAFHVSAKGRGKSGLADFGARDGEPEPGSKRGEFFSD
jgi:hypothetical protein